MIFDVLIIGAGASGLAASTVLNSTSLKFGIIDSNDRIGKKLILTGNGRCNISNSSIPFNNNYNIFYHGNEVFINKIIKSFNLKELYDFFNHLGLPLIVEENNKIYPMSLQASSVVDVFLMELQKGNGEIILNHKVFHVRKEDKIFKVFTKYDGAEEILLCKNLIIAGGGMSYPSTGSDGSCYKFAKIFSHSIAKPFPSLVQLKLDYGKLKALSGVKFKGNAHIYVNNNLERKEFGEILFTDYGISGPPILQLSRIASKASSDGNMVEISLDLFPSFNEEDLCEFFVNRFSELKRSVSETLIGVINKKLIPIVLKDCNIVNIHMPSSELKKEEILCLAKTLKAWRFKVIGTTSFPNSQVTAGGIATNEINPETMESKLQKKLYFAGEIIDIDGDCGGLNLHFAFATGCIAANAVIKAMES